MIERAPGEGDSGGKTAPVPVAWPRPETNDLGRYLEDTITIDWQTPALMSQARALLEGVDEAAARVARLFDFVRCEIADSARTPSEAQTCRASEVLAARTGLSFARSHLLAALLRFAGYPTGFCYARRVRSDLPGRFALEGFNAVYWGADAGWHFLDVGSRDPRSDGGSQRIPPFDLVHEPDVEAGECFLPFIYKRPSGRIIDLLERAPSLEAVCRNLPDAL